MAAFAYKGLNAKGRNVSGVRDAENARMLRAQLRREGIYATDVSETREEKRKGVDLNREVSFKELFDRVSLQDIAILTRQLATLLRAGVPLAEALGALVEQASSERMQRVLADVRTKVNQGTSLADALKDHAKIFTPLYVNMVRAGETAGNLEDVLNRLADFMESQSALKNKIQSAMMYPILMAGISVGICALLMVVVVPKVTQIFDDLGKALPWNTQLLIWISSITGRFWWLLLILAGFAFYGFQRWRKQPKGKRILDAMLLKIWIVGPIVRMVAIAGSLERRRRCLLAQCPCFKH